MRLPNDWTVALDAGLRGLPLTCTSCGSRERHEALWDIWECGPFALAVVRCFRCQITDPTGARMKALLEHRYRPEMLRRKEIR